MTDEVQEEKEVEIEPDGKIFSTIGLALMRGLHWIVKIKDPNKRYYMITEKFSTDKLMMHLDKDQLETLEEAFSQHPNGILLPNFVWLMKDQTPHKEYEKYDLVYGLCWLFDEIDINGDLHMEWQEFTQYIIDEVMQNPVKIQEE